MTEEIEGAEIGDCGDRYWRGLLLLCKAGI
jgi:hypothetical protein